MKTFLIHLWLSPLYLLVIGLVIGAGKLLWDMVYNDPLSLLAVWACAAFVSLVVYGLIDESTD